MAGETQGLSGPPPARCRPRDLGIVIGLMPPGPTNSIVDVPGVKVGHATVWRDEPRPPAGRGTARSGVTVVLPDAIDTLSALPIHAGVAVLNGSGEMTARTQIDEQGVIESPIFLTSTMAVGRVYDAADPPARSREPGRGSRLRIGPRRRRVLGRLLERRAIRAGR